MGTEQSLPSVPPCTFIALGYERGQHMARLIGNLIHPMQNLSVLDLGCQLGGISLAFSKVCHQVTAVDAMYDWKRQMSWKEKKDIANHSFLNADGLTLPLKDNTFDLVLINGVLEWVGFVEHQKTPEIFKSAACRKSKGC